MKRKQKDKSPKRLKVFSILITAVVVAAIITVIFNHTQTNYDELNAADKQILTELDEYMKANETSEIWAGFELQNKTIAAVSGSFGRTYIINPVNDIKSLFAAEIKMPEGSSLKVYRASLLAPQTLSIRLSLGNFNGIGQTYSAFGNDVYFTKYSLERSIEPINSSAHYITFLTHEAFHYYMQNNWAGGSRFTGNLSNNDLALMAQEYNILSDIQTELAKVQPSQDLLINYAKQYVDVMDQRIVSNPQYVNQELSMETAEGTATYVGIKASDIVNYDFGVMYFNNVKNVSCSEIIPLLQAGKIDVSFLANRMPYETGALLCQLLDALQVKGWQESLNTQTLNRPITLYDIIKESVS